MDGITQEPRKQRAFGTAWDWSWGLLFVCVMTLLSMATQQHSGYVEPHVTEAHAVAPAARSPR